MTTGIMLTIGSLFLSVLLIVVFYSKSRIPSKENKVFGKIILINLFGVIMHILCFVTNKMFPTDSIYVLLSAKLYLVYLVSWATCFTWYVIIISNNENITEKRSKQIVYLLFLAVIISTYLIITRQISFHVSSSEIYSYGPSVKVVYNLISIYYVVWTFFLLKNIKNIVKKVYIPIFSFMILGGVATIVQKNFPGIQLMTFLETFIGYLMYFTIENPDMKLLKEMHEAKEISDNANEEKTLFLYNMTQEIRATTKNIDNEADIIIDSDDIDTDKESARNIKGETSKFRMMTNDILDVSAIDSSKVKIYNTSYNLKMLLRTIISSYTDICHNKNLEFRTNIEHNIPQSLYGDNISLKKAINLLLTYSVKSTKKGYVELDINTIIKNDIVRLIITIEDSSMGIKSSDLEKIKIDNKNISESYKLITLMNGTMVLTSNYGSGNKIKIILDQKIDKTPNKEEKKYQSILEDKKILIIDNSEPSIKIIEKLLKGSNINIDYSLNGRDAYNKIKTRNRYDLILLDEELNTISGYEMLKNLQGIRNFNIPVILLSKDNKYEYNEEYLKMGFSDILIKPLSKEILLEKINKNVMNRVDILTKDKETK